MLERQFSKEIPDFILRQTLHLQPVLHDLADKGGQALPPAHAQVPAYFLRDLGISVFMNVQQIHQLPQRKSRQRIIREIVDRIFQIGELFQNSGDFPDGISRFDAIKQLILKCASEIFKMPDDMCVGLFCKDALLCHKILNALPGIISLRRLSFLQQVFQPVVVFHGAAFGFRLIGEFDKGKATEVLGITEINPCVFDGDAIPEFLCPAGERAKRFHVARGGQFQFAIAADIRLDSAEIILQFPPIRFAPSLDGIHKDFQELYLKLARGAGGGFGRNRLYPKLVQLLRQEGNPPAFLEFNDNDKRFCPADVRHEFYLFDNAFAIDLMRHRLAFFKPPGPEILFCDRRGGGVISAGIGIFFPGRPGDIAMENFGLRGCWILVLHCLGRYPAS